MTAPRFLVAGAVTAINVGLAVAIGVPSPRPTDILEQYETAMLVIPPPLRSDRLSVRFTLCDGPIHVNCVVDGDTFWFRGDKIRIADIDAPEIFIDSKNSLDANSPMRDSVVMIAQPYQLYIERTDASKNMARFYAMAIEPTLFGDICLTRRWGRIGAQGQMMKHSFAREDEAVRLFLDLLRQKRNRGYHPKGKQAAT